MAVLVRPLGHGAESSITLYGQELGVNWLLKIGLGENRYTGGHVSSKAAPIAVNSKAVAKS